MNWTSQFLYKLKQALKFHAIYTIVTRITYHKKQCVIEIIGMKLENSFPILTFTIFLVLETFISGEYTVPCPKNSRIYFSREDDFVAAFRLNKTSKHVLVFSILVLVIECVVGSIKIRIFFRSTSDIYREVHWATEIPNVKEFFKNVHSES